MTIRDESIDVQDLKPLTFPLFGSRLIEASAGTGKTWTIAALYVRLVLGHDPDLGNEQDFSKARLPSEILVMTFTRAATRELSERIRGRLIEAVRYFREETQARQEDDFLISLRHDYPSGKSRDQASWRLAMAAESMDEAAVHTIDAWCQRMLKEHAFDSGCLFDEELVADEDLLRIEACQDYWRQQCYPLSADHLSTVLSVWPSVNALIGDMKYLLDKDVQDDIGLDSIEARIDAAVAKRNHELGQLKSVWRTNARAMLEWLNGQIDNPVLKKGWNTRSLKKPSYTGWLNTLIAWCDDPDAFKEPTLKTGWDRFTPKGMEEVRVVGSGPYELPAEFKAFGELREDIEFVNDIKAPLRRHAALWISVRLAKLKREAGTFGFADMLCRLDRALSTPASGERLRQRILSQYPVALIDEFQDTSPLQFNIFDQIYRTGSNSDQTALLLIGDPKQSIYGFRGADIYSYIKARQATKGRHYVLKTNYRSTHAVVNVVNRLFSRVDRHPNRPDGAFLFKRFPGNPLPFVDVQANGRAEYFVDSTGKVPALTLVHSLTDLQSADQLRDNFSALCAEQIVAWLNDAQAGFAEDGKKTVPLRPKDIAVLVRTGKEAAAVRKHLSRRGVSSVYLSDKDSVFNSPEARDLYFWLQAVAMPGNVRFVRAALATRMIGFSLADLQNLAQDEEAFDTQAERLRDLQSVWQSQGVLAMLRRTLHQFDLPSRWLKESEGERSLTNFLHLSELLQSASSHLEGEQALIRWFKTEMEEQSQASEDQIVRLESDEDLVKVITIHKSKGLEYQVVLLPFVTSFRAAKKEDSSFMDVPDEQGKRNLILKLNSEMTERADRERLKEDLRLLYVGLTRARHALWVGFSAVKFRNTKTCISHQSAIGYLLNGGHEIDEPAKWIEPLEAFVQDISDHVPVASEWVRLVPASPQIALTRLVRKSDQIGLLEHPPYRCDFDKNWSIGSFSRLTKDIVPLKTQLSALQIAQPADDESDQDSDADADALSILMPVIQTAGQGSHAIRHVFHKGPIAGNFLHDQLEWLAGEKFALADDIDLQGRLKRRCERFGYDRHADGLVEWLSAIVQTVLPGPNASLNVLEQVLPEMEFWLPTSLIQTPLLDELCRKHLLNGHARSSLPDRELHGMLMGYADLVFEHNGKFWVLDYKSNYLGKDDLAYDFAAMEKSMAEHRYDMQAALYMLSLHRLLKKRLGDRYDPFVHMGGAVYLFLRGINGPSQGTYVVPPSVDMLLELDAMLGETEGSAS